MKKIILSYKNYKLACDEAFRVNMSNPTVFWNEIRGFYVRPSRDLCPNMDLVINLASYDANTGERSLRGTRREYAPIARGIQNYYSGNNDKSLEESVHDSVDDDNYNEYLKSGKY
jgi:hypothetical protein